MDLIKNNDAEAVIMVDDDDESEEDVNSGNFEFSVREDKVMIVNSLKEKIRVLYGVTIKEDIRAKETDDKNAIRQWFNIVGPLDNCRQAKAFILATCDPGQVAIFEFDPTLHKVLSNESQKMRIEKESKTLLLFGGSDEGSVVIQGVDELSIGVAMSLLEGAAYEASIALISSPSKDHQTLLRKEDEVIPQRSRRQIESYAKTDPVVCEDRMEVYLSDLELTTGEETLDVMKSPDPEIQRLVKCGREKHYTDEEICEVLEKNNKIPTASAFFRALHTCRNLKAISSRSSVHQSSTSDVMLHDITVRPSNSDFKLDFTLLQTKDIAQEEQSKPTMSVTNRNGNLDCELCEDIDIQRPVKTVENTEKHYQGIKTVDRISNPVKKEVRSDSVLNIRPVSDLMSISDDQERKRQAEANQQLNRKLFVEQSCASASKKSYSSDRVTNLDEFPMPGDANASDSGLDITPNSPSNRKRQKKKKKKNTVDLIAKEHDYRSRSPLKLSDREETTLQSTPSQRTKDPNTATATITQAGRLQSEKMADNIRKNPDFGPQVIANAPACKQIVTKPNPPALYPPFALDASRTSVSKQLRYIVIDGSNIAMTHGNGKIFSCRGIEIAVQHFQNRGHKEITVFVPQWRRQMPRYDDQNPIKDQDILAKLKDEGIMNFTPSRRIPGKKSIVCYDDRFILRLAQDTNGIVVSNDNYRDLYMEKPEWAEIIETRVLSYTFVGDRFMLPDDPLGREGPNLDEFLSLRSKTIQPSIHNYSFSQLQHPPPNPRSQFEVNPSFFARQSTSSFVPVIPTRPWQTASQHTRLGLPNTGYWFRPPHTQDIGQWTNKINHAGIPIQTGRFPFRTSSAPFVSNPRELPKFTVERAPVSRILTPAGTFYNQTAKHPSNSGQHRTNVSPSVQLRSETETNAMKSHLMEVFPDQEEQIKGLLLKNKTERDLTLLIDLLLEEATET